MAKLGAHPQPLKWDAKQLEAVDLVFAGLLTYAEVAARVQTSESSVKRWMQHPEFKAKLAEKRADFRAHLEDATFADKARRVFALDQAAKIAFAELQARPLVTETRPTRDGPITNESFNQAAMSEFRAALDDIAKELGDRKNVAEVSGTIDVRAQVQFYMPQPEEPPHEYIDSEPPAIASGDSGEDT